MIKTKRKTLLFRKKKYTRKKRGGLCMPWDKECKNKRKRIKENKEEEEKQSRLLEQGKKRVEDLWENDKKQLVKSYKYFTKFDGAVEKLKNNTSYIEFIIDLEIFLKYLANYVEELQEDFIQIKKNTSISEKEKKRKKYKKLVERLEEIQKYHNNFKWSKWFSEEDRPYVEKMRQTMKDRQTDVVDDYDDDDEALPVNINAWDTKNLKEGMVEETLDGRAGFIGGKRRRTKRKKRRRRRTKRKKRRRRNRTKRK